LAGSAACRGTAEALRDALARSGTAVELEPFLTHPSAFTLFYRIDVLLYALGVGLLFLNQPLAAALILTFMLVGAGLQFGYYVELYDRLYPQKMCTNVSAVLEPRGTVERQLIFSAHHDSALELKFLKGSQKLYGLKIIVPDAVRFLAAVTAWVWVGWQVSGGRQTAGSPLAPDFILLARAILVPGFYFVFSKFHLFGDEATPGAGDNLIASALLVELAARFRAKGEPGRSILQHTRLILVSFDAEESGLRGSRAWVRAHRPCLAALPTSALNIDSIYRLQELQFLTSDLNSHVKLDRPLAEQCLRIAHRLGYPAAPAVMRFGGGATDAAELTRAGVRATTMIAMSTRLVRDGLVYHTMQDTVDAIEPAAVAACLAVAEGLAWEMDG
jgi:aminopeptidase YwaD